MNRSSGFQCCSGCSCHTRVTTTLEPHNHSTRDSKVHQTHAHLHLTTVLCCVFLLLVIFNMFPIHYPLCIPSTSLCNSHPNLTLACFNCPTHKNEIFGLSTVYLFIYLSGSLIILLSLCRPIYMQFHCYFGFHYLFCFRYLSGFQRQLQVWSGFYQGIMLPDYFSLLEITPD